MSSATMRIPTYRLGEQIPWNKKIYHVYSNGHRQYGTPLLRQMMTKWVVRNDPPTKAVTQDKSYWNSFGNHLAGTPLGANNRWRDASQEQR